MGFGCLVTSRMQSTSIDVAVHVREVTLVASTHHSNSVPTQNATSKAHIVNDV